MVNIDKGLYVEWKKPVRVPILTYLSEDET